MGLLTDPSAGRGKLTVLLEAHHGKLCVFLYLAGILCFAVLAHEHFNAGTYFSENALLPGLVESEYDEDHTAKKLLVELKDEAVRYPEFIPYPWLLAKFGQLGLEPYTHNFTLNYPLGRGTKYQGRNVYAILRAPRGASTEAVVLSTPYRPPSSSYPTTHPSIALLLSLAKFFRRQKYWAKDLVFLITEHEQLGTQAWLEAYHQAPCGQAGVLDHGDLPARAGSIQAAINLELHSDRLSHIDVKVEGLNGQLPNLDLVNLVHRLCAMESVRHTFHNRENPNFMDPWRQWSHHMRTLLGMVFTQASGMTDGNHGLFHRFGIEAVTIEGFERRAAGGALMFYQLGRVMEGVCRSLNNLLERFHQSFFFYLLPATDRYISIGAYMPSLGLMCAALLIRAFALWLRTHEPTQREQEAEDEGDTEEKKKEKKSLAGQAIPVLVQVGAVVLAVHVLGMVVLSSPCPLTRYGLQFFGLPTAAAMGAGALLGSLLLLAVASVASRAMVWSVEATSLLNIAGLLELATLLLAVAMHNFSLALLCGTFFTPVALAIGIVKRWWLRGLVRLLWLLLHPLTLLALVVLVSARNHYPGDDLQTLLNRAAQGTQEVLVLVALDSQIYGSWVFAVASGTLLPTWLLFWMAA